MKPEDVARPQRVYHWISVGAAFPVLGLTVCHHYALAAMFGCISAGALAVRAMAYGYVEGFEQGTWHAENDAARHTSALMQEADPDIWLDVPLPPEGQGHLYVIQFHTGVVKVGQTNHPARRLPEHRRDSWAYGAVLTKAWISGAHSTYLANEVELISFASGMGQRARLEYFHGADFDRVVKFARNLVEASAPTTV